VTPTTEAREQPDEGPIIPREMLWIYPIAPLGGAFLLVQDLFRRDGWSSLRNVAAVYVPFLVYSAVFHVLYARVVPVIFRRLRSPRGRWALHVGLGAVVPVALGPIVVPLHEQICLHQVPRGWMLGVSVVISWVYLLPAIAVQQFRQQATRQERRAAAERQAALEAQLTALQARTNPHFFFNSINTVASLIPEDPELAERTLERLAEIFRYALDASRTRTVPLRREVEILRDYAEIQRARFGDRLAIEIEMDERAGATPVPALLLQPLVENAILHGVARRARGSVKVAVRWTGSGVLVEVSDDGPGPGRSEHRGSRTSVDELRERLRLVYGPGGTLTLATGPAGGCVATVIIPEESE
jgi:two-component system sensor histidine kinase AlgZ